MIVYSATRGEFTEDVNNNLIESRIAEEFTKRLGHRTSPNEIRSWRNSLGYMNTALQQGDIPEDAGVAIEFVIPSTSKRVDFLLSGKSNQDKETVVIVELKQWENVSKTDKPSIVKTFVGRGIREMVHPSYQAWTYKAFIEDFNTEVQRSKIDLVPCSYLHNCIDTSEIISDFYDDDLNAAPLFGRHDARKIADFLNEHIVYGDHSRIVQRIEKGKLRPSKHLVDHLVSLLEGNQEFTMIDDQKVVYETALEFATRANQTKSAGKQVLLVEGGPGTGKSVVAINLMVELIKRGLVAQYVTRNTAPREVFEAKLQGSFKKTQITNLFKGAGSYIDEPTQPLGALIVDEAHRLSLKSGRFGNLGENQVKEIIRAANSSIFFLDEDQRVILNDVGDREEIKKWSQEYGATLREIKLESQFRCNGSDGYLSWINNVLQIRETANMTLDGIDYDFRVLDSPNELRQSILEKHDENFQARMVAGYCWDWVSKKDPTQMDVVLPEFDFAMQWNLNSDGSTWIIKPDSISEIGCIHTCQGLELDYVGVIIGLDFVVRGGEVHTDANKRAKYDRTIKGFKNMQKENPQLARAETDSIIRNTYRTLMTRGQKGCYIYCVDPETNSYFKNAIRKQS